LLPTIVYLLKVLRRAFNKSGRGLSMTAEVFHEAMEDWRKSTRKYPFAE
jgi:hypothetical protein